jgi:hypothetical protein
LQDGVNDRAFPADDNLVERRVRKIRLRVAAVAAGCVQARSRSAPSCISCCPSYCRQAGVQVGKAVVEEPDHRHPAELPHKGVVLARALIRPAARPGTAIHGRYLRVRVPLSASASSTGSAFCHTSPRNAANRDAAAQAEPQTKTLFLVGRDRGKVRNVPNSFWI